MNTTPFFTIFCELLLKSIAVAVAALVAGCTLVQVKKNPDANASNTLIEVEAKFVELSENAMKQIAPLTAGTLNEQQTCALFEKLSTADGVDILSCPKVTTVSKQPASIQIGRELISPTDWEMDPQTGAWKPKVVETNHIGITFGIQATAKAKDEIEMILEPKIVDLLGYIDLDDGGKKIPCTRDETIKMPAGHRMKPVFSDRTLKTSVTTMPGQTVLVGGLTAQTGFANPQPEKKQLLVFVTARIVTTDCVFIETIEQIVLKRMQSIVIPKMTFRPPATIVDAIDFLNSASRDYDDPEIPLDQRGVNVILKLPFSEYSAPGAIPVIQAMSARHISLYDALKQVCDLTGMKFRIGGNFVMVEPRDAPDAQVKSPSDKALPPMHCHQPLSDDQIVIKKLKNIIIPEMTFRPPATLEDFLNFLKSASRDYDDPEIPLDQRGVNVILKLPPKAKIPVIQAMSARNLSLSDAFKLGCEMTGMKFQISGNLIIVVPRIDPD